MARAQYALVLKEGGQLRTHPANEGRTVNFTRRTPQTIITTPLGELSNPVTCVVDSCTVAMTLSEYGQTIITSKLATLIGIDSRMKETVELAGQNMGETLNRLVRDELKNGTSFYGNDHAVTSFAAGDTLDACDIRAIVKTLELNKARAYPDGMYIGKTDPISKYNLIGDSTWVNSKTYSDVKDLYKGEMGELYQVRWLLNKDYACGTEATSTASSGVIRFYTYVHGADSFGAYDLNKIGSFCRNTVKKFREFGRTLINEIRQYRAELSFEIGGVQTMYGIARTAKDIVGTMWQHIEIGRNVLFAL